MSASPQLTKIIQSTPTADYQTRSVLSNLRLWTVPRKLSICFLSGGAELRKRVASSIQKQWPIAELSEGRLDYGSSFTDLPDCSQTPIQHDIRVDFAKGDGKWSYVGIESLKHSPSMNLGGFNESPPASEEFDRIVGHEMGHALGLEHEHQSPKAPDCKWNYEYLFKAYKWKTRAEMITNLKRLSDYLKGGRRAYIFSNYDKLSEMHYKFEPEAFDEGDTSPCFVSQSNATPSSLDRGAIRVAYGLVVLQQQALAKDAIPKLLSKDTEELAAVKDLLRLKQRLLAE